MARKSLPERMDDFARWTRLPAVLAAVNKVRRRHLRWTSAIALGAATLGMALALVLARTYAFWLGYSLVVLGFSIGSFLPMFGPLKPWGSSELIDEWDRELRRRAFLAGFATVSATAIFGLVLLLALALLGDWDRGLLLLELATFTFYLFALLAAVPTFHASWTTRPIVEDERE